jgi:hypothetical protein
VDNLFSTGIRPSIDAYLKAKSEEVRSYGSYWSASSAGYCMRLVMMRRLGVPKVPELEDNATQTRIFEAGHIFHEWLQRITKDAGLSIASEVELQDEKLMIRGHFDDLILIPGYDPAPYGMPDDAPMSWQMPDMVPDKLILYDYKTAHSASFKFKQMQTSIGHYHKMQLGTYMYMLRKWDKHPNDGTKYNQYMDAIHQLSEARILSISKDDLRMDEKQLLWSPALEKQVYEYWATLNGYWKKKELPRCTCLEHDGGFMGRRSAKGKIYNDFFYNDEPCSLEWLKKCKQEGRVSWD